MAGAVSPTPSHPCVPSCATRPTAEQLHRLRKQATASPPNSPTPGPGKPHICSPSLQTCPSGHSTRGTTRYVGLRASLSLGTASVRQTRVAAALVSIALLLIAADAALRGRPAAPRSADDTWAAPLGAGGSAALAARTRLCTDWFSFPLSVSLGLEVHVVTAGQLEDVPGCFPAPLPPAACGVRLGPCLPAPPPPFP